MSTSPEATSKLQQLQQELEKEVAAFEGLLEQHALDMRVRQWLRSSAYATYELLAVCRDEQESARGQGRAREHAGNVGTCLQHSHKVKEGSQRQGRALHGAQGVPT
eukprot:1153229-Pelagomonas_calceolata.AAC.10